MHRCFKHKKNYFFNLLNKQIKRVFTRFSFILLKLSPKIVLLTLLLLPYSWNLQATISKNYQKSNRSDAILMTSPTISYARPVLFYGLYNDGYDGPPNIWSTEKGFLVQSTDPASYGLNFPTTGMDSLYFDLLIEGVDINTLKWEPVTHSGITATVKTVVAKEWWIPNEDRKLVTRVKLTGPKASDDQIQSNNPNPLTKPNLPQIFELVAKDIYGNEVVKYGFELKQWFVPRTKRRGCNSTFYYDIFPKQETWCRSLGRGKDHDLEYRIVKVKDLTNAVCKDYFHSCDQVGPSPGATPASPSNHYQRQIGAGLIAEWGSMQEYNNDAFNPVTYPYFLDSCSFDKIWASDTLSGTNFRYWISGNQGMMFTEDPPAPGQIESSPMDAVAVCVTPP
ncbi:hypothetical protein [Gilliamella intestini]|uniref:Uncharacterized protein n=1 Tax=Gilliamella intestini TaxID=1798183 RepID=A0A1C4ACW4_9GAMM|nr:hypothetical protein [Gilliamella intestini]SCB92522.1 hypothetical protein GA0061080_101032 [Gilliamella intestini]